MIDYNKYTDSLKDCPFCGNRPRYSRIMGNHIISCDCGAALTNKGYAMILLRDAWNHRVENKTEVEDNESFY